MLVADTTCSRDATVFASIDWLGSLDELDAAELMRGRRRVVEREVDA